MIRLTGAIALTVIVILGSGRISAAAVTVPSFAAFDGVGIERGVARVICHRRGSTSVVRVRAIVLDLGMAAPRREVVVAPAHGLPPEASRIRTDCRLSGGRGAPKAIADFWLSEDRHAGPSGDWAVFITHSPFSEPIGRLRVGVLSSNLLEQLLVDQRPLGVMLSHSAADRNGCRVLRLLAGRAFSHSCGGWAGSSGAPILLDVDQEPVVIGIQIGRIMRPVNAGGPLFSGVGLAIDDEMAAAIQQAVERVRSDDASEGAGQ